MTNKKLKVIVVSDLHLEFDSNISVEYWPDADILAFCGDIGVGLSARKLVRRAVVSGKFGKVFYLMGNHEGYNHTWEENKRLWKEAAAEDGFVFLDGETIFELEDCIVTGGTLWSDLSDPADSALAMYYMNDYSKVRSIASFDPMDEDFVDKVLAVDINDPDTWFNPSPATRYYEVNSVRHRVRSISAHLTTLWHTSDVQCIEYGIEVAKQVGKKLLVFTHHTPSEQCLNEKHSRGNSKLNPAYFTNLEHLMPDVALWGCGHTHNRMDTIINGCRVVMNGRGYIGSYFEGGREIPEEFTPQVVELEV